MKISFKSTYAIPVKYYMMGEQCFPTYSDALIENVSRKIKSNGDLSAYNPKKKVYYVDFFNKKQDAKFEKLAQEFGVEYKKVRKNSLKNSIIISVGKSNYDCHSVTKIIEQYEEKLFVNSFFEFFTS